MADRVRDAIRERWLAGDSIESLVVDFGISDEEARGICRYEAWDVVKERERVCILVPGRNMLLEHCLVMHEVSADEARRLAVSLLSATDPDVAERVADGLADTARFLAIDHAIADVVNANVGTWVREDAEQKLIRLLREVSGG